MRVVAVTEHYIITVNSGARMVFWFSFSFFGQKGLIGHPLTTPENVTTM
jgi:hypothetical protein